jgi:polyhydroxyalkanoate synthesis repressor PhaR
MVKEGVDFVVYDAKTNDDITRSVLTQIIFEEENRGGGQNLLPIQFLRQLIGFYGNSMQAFLPSYLEMSLESFTKQQERMRTQFSGLTPGAGPRACRASGSTKSRSARTWRCSTGP